MIGDGLKQGYLALNDGRCFSGFLFGADPDETVGEESSLGEVVFNTSMSGYQEIITDPSYSGQIIVFTTSHVGNVGCNPGDDESDHTFANGIVVNDLSQVYSNYRGEESLDEFCKRQGLTGIAGIDTRAVTRHLRDAHSWPGGIAATKTQALEGAQKAKKTDGCNIARVVSTKEIYEYGNPDAKYKVAVFDFGVKRSILDHLVDQNMHLTVLPWNQGFYMGIDSSLENFDGVFLSNGPGDPSAVENVPKTIQQVLEAGIPLFGICLGHQILSIALGAETHKLDFGHHGGNHPVMDLTTNAVAITSQNHNYATVEGTDSQFEVTHRNLNDETIEGIVAKNYKAFSVQHHPEASPGPNEAKELFVRFTNLIEENKG